MPVKEKELEEYELIPMSPLRRLEKRVEEVESSHSIDAREFLREIVDIIRMNQQLVDELAKANDALRIELSRLPGRIEELIKHLEELLSYIKASAAEEVTSTESFKPLIGKLDELVDANKKIAEGNQSVLSALEEIDRKLRRPVASMPIRKPMLQRPVPT